MQAMLRFTTGQFGSLDAHLAASRDAALVAYARRRFGTHLQAASHVRLLGAAQEARRLASGWGMQHEADVATVFDLAVMYGSGFADAEWAADILQASDRDGGDKAEALRARVRRTVPGF